MNAVVVDTDVVSLIFKGDSRADVLVNPFWARSARLVHDGSGVGTLDSAGQVGAGPHRSVPSSRDLIVKWAEAMVVGRAQGRRIDVADAWIAATALLYDAPLVTNNPGDYIGVAGIKLL
jgi:hypothetical protein